MSAKVTFAPARPREMRADATLPVLLDRMLAKWNLKKRFKGKRVAIKMHLGQNVGYATVHPFLVARVVKAVRDAGGRPFITDIPVAIPTARVRGYTEEVLGAPLRPAAGVGDKYIYPRTVNYRALKKVHVAGEIADADAMIVLSHGKGHGNSGFGGAIKNVAMGCVDTYSRGQIHRLTRAAFKWNQSKCTACLLCRDNCPNSAITYENKKIAINDHACKYCMHCVNVCPKGAISIDQRGYRYFQRGMALATREVVKTFEPGRVLYVTVLLDVTPFCDCWGFTTPAIVPDIGIVAGEDIVAVETAALDLIKAEDFIEGSLPYPLRRSGTGHLLKQIHGKDPYLQVKECIRAGLGNEKYRLVKIR